MEKVLTVEYTQEGSIGFEGTCNGDVFIVPNCNGKFWGEKLNGKMLPVGSGTLTIPYEGQNDVDTVYALETDEGDKLLMYMKAFVNMSPETENRISNNEPVDLEEYYCKAFIWFETGCKKYKWLEKKVCVGNGVVPDWNTMKFDIYMF